MPTIYKPVKNYKRERWGDDKENHKYYQTTRWKRLREDYFRKHPLCEMCLDENVENEDGSKGSVIKQAEEIHHIIPISNNNELAYDWNNLQSLCKHHHHLIHNQMKNQK